MDHQNKIDLLWSRLHILKQTQREQSIAIQKLEDDIKVLQDTAKDQPLVVEQKAATTPSIQRQSVQNDPVVKPALNQTNKSEHNFQNTQTANKSNFSIEQFLGEKVVAKLGVFILLIGLIIGSKYAIDQNLVTPLMRIIFSYTIGLGLIVIAYFSIRKYKLWSGIIFSGALAIFFFTTFFAHDTYELLSKEVAFGLMLLFSIFMFLASLYYNEKYISIIALTGSYALPFLLSDGSGNYIFLFSYIIIVNLGIIAIAYFKEWSIVYYLSFVLSWIIFFAWIIDTSLKTHAYDAAIFSSIFFLQFYCMIVLNKWVKHFVFKVQTLMILVGNALFYLIAGTTIIYANFSQEEIPLTIFILINAIIHAGFAYSLYKKSIFDPAAIWVLLAMVITLIVIIVPVNFDGEVISLSWLTMSILLAYGAHKIQHPSLKIYSLILMGISLLSLFIDVSLISQSYHRGLAFRDISFYIVLVCIFLIYLKGNLIRKWYNDALNSKMVYYGWGLSGLAIILWAFSLSTEIHLLFNQFESIPFNINNIDYYNFIWSEYNSYINIILALTCSILIYKYIILPINNIEIQYIAYFILLLVIGISFLEGTKSSLSILNINKGDAIKHTLFASTYFPSFAYLYLAGIYTSFFIWIKHLKVFELPKYQIIKPMTLLILNLVFLSILLSFIMISISQTKHLSTTLSIFWGIYALILFIIGFKKDLNIIRKGAFILAGISLIKLIFVDLKNTNNLQKTILFVVLGMIFIAVSYLYNKFKDRTNVS